MFCDGVFQHAEAETRVPHTLRFKACEYWRAALMGVLRDPAGFSPLEVYAMFFKFNAVFSSAFGRKRVWYYARGTFNARR